MPNWCWSSHIATGDKIQVRDLYEKMRSLAERDTSLVKNDFGKTWFGNLVTLLGGDWNTIYCRGEYEDLQIDSDDGAVRFTAMSAWGEPNEVIKFLQEKYPALTFYYQAEEPGNGHFVTNDASGEYFPERYYFSCPDDCEPFFYEEEEIDGFLRDVGKFVCKEIHTIEEAQTAIREYNKTVTDRICAEIRVYKVISQK